MMAGFKDEEVRKSLSLSEKEQPLSISCLLARNNCSLFFFDE
jgi:hypothetical protein